MLARRISPQQHNGSPISGRRRTGKLGEIRVEHRSCGVRAVFLVEVEDPASAGQVSAFFEGLSADVSVVELSRGKLTSYAVQLVDDDQALLREIEEYLGENYPFVIVHRHLDRLFYEMMLDLCRQTGSTVRSVTRCGLCGSPEPFPVLVSFFDDRNAPVAERAYCSHCLADLPQDDARSFLRALTQADKPVADLVGRLSSRRTIALSIHCPRGSA